MNGLENVETVPASAWYVRVMPRPLKSERLQNPEARARKEKEHIVLARHVVHPRQSALGSEPCANDVNAKA